jgi:hypothetical protein
MIKEEWYFDKQNSTMNVRIIGICPIQEYYRDEDVNRENVQRRQSSGYITGSARLACFERGI